MTDSAYRVETTSRVALWRIDTLASCSYRKSNPFDIGYWSWHLSVETVTNSRSLFIKLYPEISNVTRKFPPLASFKIRLVSSVGERKCLVHPEITDKEFKTNEDFVWAVEVPFTGKFIIDVEFLNLKMSSPDVAGHFSIWWCGGLMQKKSIERTLLLSLGSLGRMLSESILTDVVINASDGSVAAHRAVLASRSPVFLSMFTHDLKEKEMSAINISDMSIEASKAFLNYMYGSITRKEFLAHRLALLRAADKYDVVDLKEACHESLLEDIDTRNVLERLQNASLYQLPKLKSSCIQYLVKFGRIFDIRDEFNAFVHCAVIELVGEVLNEILAAWKGF